MNKTRKIVYILYAVVMAALIICLPACNKQVIDLTYNFNYAIIRLPNGEIVEGAVQSWKDFADGDQLQIKIDGVTYLVHSTNVALESR